MKNINIFFTSQASTSISLTTMDEPSSSIISSPSPSSSPNSSYNNNILLSRSPAIDRYNPIIRDSRRISTTINNNPPLVFTKPHKNHHRKKKHNLTKENGDQVKKADNSTTSQKADVDDHDENVKIVSTNYCVKKNSWSCTKPSDFISPPGSTRYLLSEKKVLFDNLSDFDPALKRLSPESSKAEVVKANGSVDAKSPCSGGSNSDQVVVLRVSLHCRGCERKMRKHISRMEGVKSFNIDFAAKKVTVTGKITPLEVLSSISKVKNAQLWPPTISSSTQPHLNLNNSEIKNHFREDGA